MRDGEIRNIRIGSHMPSFKNIDIQRESNVAWTISLGDKIVWKLRPEVYSDITIIRGWISNNGFLYLNNSTDVTTTTKIPKLLENNQFEMIDITFGNENFTGTIDWGDGTTQTYKSFTQTTYNDNIYNGIVHQYDSDYITQNTQDNGVWVEIKIKYPLPYISRTNFFAETNGFKILHSIEFADSIKYFNNNFSFEAIENFYCTVPKDIFSNVLPSLMYGFPYEISVDLSNSKVEFLGVPRLYTNINDNDYSLYHLYYGTFNYNNKLKNVKLNDNIKLFSDMCFLYNNNLETINIPKNLECIGYDCFAYCSKLKPFQLNEGLKYIFDLGLYSVGYDLYPDIEPIYPDDYSYTYLDAPKNNYLTYPFQNKTAMDIYYIPNSVEFIGSQALSSKWWKIVSIGNNIKYLGTNFYTQANTPFNDVIYRGTISEWFNIKFVLTYNDLRNVIGLNQFFNCVAPDNYFYANSSGQIYRIICNDGIIINPFVSGTLSNGDSVSPQQYGNNCFDNTGKAIREKFLII